MKWNPAKVKRLTRKLNHNSNKQYLPEKVALRYQNYLVKAKMQHFQSFDALIEKETRRGRIGNENH